MTGMEESEEAGERGECGMEEGERERLERMVGRMRDMERKLEWREREEMKKNIVMRGLKVGEGNIETGIEKVMKDIGVEVRIEEVRRIKTGKGEWGEMVVVKLGSEEEKKKVMEGKKKLRGEKVWIMEDLTWEERKMRWKMKEIAKREEEKGNKV